MGSFQYVLFLKRISVNNPIIGQALLGCFFCLFMWPSALRPKNIFMMDLPIFVKRLQGCDYKPESGYHVAQESWG